MRFRMCHYNKKNYRLMRDDALLFLKNGPA